MPQRREAELLEGREDEEKEEEEEEQGRRRRTRENPGCISDAAIHPPVPCPLLISPYKYSLSHLDARP